MASAAAGDPAAGGGRTVSVTAGGVRVTRTAEPFDEQLLAGLCAQAEQVRGGVLSSGMEYPGRYSRWHLAYLNPCLELTGPGTPCRS